MTDDSYLGHHREWADNLERNNRSSPGGKAARPADGEVRVMQPAEPSEPALRVAGVGMMRKYTISCTFLTCGHPWCPLVHVSSPSALCVLLDPPSYSRCTC